jgi:hypothetical protein
VFEREESVALLRGRIVEVSDDEVDQLAEGLGDLPLAVERAGAWLATTAMPVHGYLELLDTRLARVLAEDPPPDYPQTAAATWLLSLERLRKQMPAAAKLLAQVRAFPQSIGTWRGDGPTDVWLTRRDLPDRSVLGLGVLQCGHHRHVVGRELA